MDIENLLKYKGWKCSLMTITTIEYEFHPYRIIICDDIEFNNENYLDKTIRCVVKDDLITNLKLN